MNRRILGLLLMAGMLSALALLAVGCGDETAVSPSNDDVNGSVVANAKGQGLSLANPNVQAAIRVQERAMPDLFTDRDVVGVGVGLNAEGQVALKVYVTESMNPGSLPREIDGLPVDVTISGRIIARGGMGGGGMGGTGGGCSDDPRAAQTGPIKLGTSGGWRYDLANGYCCGGTLGSLIQIGGSQYVLSNWHVLYSDIVSGGNNRVAQAGDPVIQPGLIDVGCNANNARNVATLVNNGGSLPSANIDAGIAAVIPGEVASDGEILCIGTLSSSTVAASVGQAVKKMGRTTGLGRGTVDALNTSVSIGYENECAGGSAFTKTYTGQIIITNNRCTFLDGGDSGSLMVEDVTSNPRAVGLLYAGSTICNRTAVAVANPINEVLSHYNASMVGN